MMTFNMQGMPYNAIVREAGGGGMPGQGAASFQARAQAAQLDQRIRAVLSRLQPTDPQAVFLMALLQRLPRGPDGSLDQRSMAEISAALDAALRGAPQALIDLLPTRKFQAAQLPKGGDADEEHTSCRVCLSSYEDGEVLRTLPCLHSFHRECIDPWLRGRKDCPICKTPIDVDSAEMVMKETMKEAGRASGGVAAGAPASAVAGSGAAGASAGSAAPLPQPASLHAGAPPAPDSQPLPGGMDGLGLRPLLGLRMAGPTPGMPPTGL